MRFAQWGGTGALRRLPETADLDLADHPSISAVLDSPLPAEVDLSSHCKVIYDQGKAPTCVAASIAGMMSGFEHMNENETIRFDFEKVYRDNGGTGLTGIPTSPALRYGVEQGYPATNGQRRKLASYAFTNDLSVVCGALAAKHFVVFAWLLPTDMLAGDCGLGTVTLSYHQTVGVGYNLEKQRLFFLNSWGHRYGHEGFGSVPFSYLRSAEQRGRFYAYSAVDILEKPVPIPEPLPSDEALLHLSYDLLINARYGAKKFEVDRLREQIKRRLHF